MDFLINLLHIFVDQIAGGRSIVRIFILVLFVLVFGIIFWVSNKQKNKKVACCKSHTKLLFGSVLVLFIVGLLTQIFLFKNLGIPQNDFAVFFNNREITSTTITHTHVLKSVAFKFAEILGVTYQENVDIGAGISPFIGDVVSYLSLILLVVIGILQLYAAYRLFPSHETRKYKTIWSIVFILTQFVLIKAMIDGGLLSEKVFVWIFVEFFLLFPINKISRIYYGFLMSFIITIGINILFVLNDALPLWQLEKRFYIECGVNIVLMIVMIYLFAKRLKRIDVLLGVLGLIFILPSIISGFSVFEYRNTSINSDAGAIIGTYSPNPNYKNILSINSLKYQVINSTTTIGDVNSGMKILDNFEPISIPWKTCIPSGVNNINFSFNSKQKPNFVSTSTTYYSFTINKKTETQNFYNGRLMVSTCIPRPLNLLNELGMSFGFEQWYIWNIRESDATFSSKQLE